MGSHIKVHPLKNEFENSDEEVRIWSSISKKKSEATTKIATECSRKVGNERR